MAKFAPEFWDSFSQFEDGFARLSEGYFDDEIWDETGKVEFGD